MQMPHSYAVLTLKPIQLPDRQSENSFFTLNVSIPLRSSYGNKIALPQREYSAVA